MEPTRYFCPSSPSTKSKKGIVLLENRGAFAKASGLKVWLSGLIATYEDRIIILDPAAAAISGRLEANAIASGHSPGMVDANIGGIAQIHDLHIITGNTKHFLPFSVAVSSPNDAIGSE